MTSNRVQERDLRNSAQSLLVLILVVLIQITQFLFIILNLA